MGRDVRRVPLDFDWPLKEVWDGYFMPKRLHERECAACGGRGYSREALHLMDQWYGNAPFQPESTGSRPFTIETPAVRSHAERNVAQAPDFYGSGEGAIQREAQRLADHWNSGWGHHLDQDDVAALIEAGRLTDFTHTWDPEKRRQAIEPTPAVTAAEVNLWSLAGMGHDSLNAGYVVEAKCKRLGLPHLCADCGGHGSIERWAGQRAEAEAWERVEPPTGEGWQMWETTSEGSPMSPVFASADELAAWLAETRASMFGGTPASKAKWLAIITGEDFAHVEIAPGVVIM